MASTDLVPRSPDDGGSALDAFLSRSVIYERAGAVIPRDLLRFGLYGTIIIIATGALALVFPTAPAIRHGQFFLLFATQAASMETVMHAAAIPLIASGVALLVLDVYLMQGRHSEQWRSAVVAQAAAGGVGGVVATVFLALVILNLMLWIAICAVVGIGIAGAITAAASGE